LTRLRERNRALPAERVYMDEFTTCFICERHPLVGEEVSLFADGSRETPVCDHCLPNPRAAALGEPVGRERIRTVEGAATVRRLIPVPVTPRAPAQEPQPSVRL
jgi:hypothetical protein